MRPAFLISLLGAAAGCATTPDSAQQPARSVCRNTDCFYERQVRDFEFFGSSTMVAYVGASRCAYRMELRGSDCSLAVGSSFVDFVDQGGRVCIYDSPYIRTEPTPFGSETRTRDGLDRCRVVAMTPLTDDELLEMYVNAGARPPLPPIGSGELSVGEDDEDGGQGGESSEPLEQSEATAGDEAGSPSAAL